MLDLRAQSWYTLVELSDKWDNLVNVYVIYYRVSYYLLHIAIISSLFILSL